MNNKIKAALILFGITGGVIGFGVSILVLPQKIAISILLAMVFTVLIVGLYFAWSMLAELLDDDNKKYKSKKAPY
jgi:hypothetical protein